MGAAARACCSAVGSAAIPFIAGLFAAIFGACCAAPKDFRCYPCPGKKLFERQKQQNLMNIYHLIKFRNSLMNLQQIIRHLQLIFSPRLQVNSSAFVSFSDAEIRFRAKAESI